MSFRVYSKIFKFLAIRNETRKGFLMNREEKRPVGRPPKTVLSNIEVAQLRRALGDILTDKKPRVFQTLNALMEHYDITYYWLQKIYGGSIYKDVGPNVSLLEWDPPTKHKPYSPLTRSDRDQIRQLRNLGMSYVDIKGALGLSINVTAISRVARGITFQGDLDDE